MRHNKTLITLISLLTLLLIPITTYAVKAHGLPVKVVQSDGSTITVRMIGDEHFHYIVASDGVVLTQDGCDYHIASVSADGSTLCGDWASCAGSVVHFVHILSTCPLWALSLVPAPVVSAHGRAIQSARVSRLMRGWTCWTCWTSLLALLNTSPQTQTYTRTTQNPCK